MKRISSITLSIALLVLVSPFVQCHAGERQPSVKQASRVASSKPSKQVKRATATAAPVSKAVASGKQEVVTVPSAMGRGIKNTVVLPAQYGKNPDERFPVLYLLHGAWGSYEDWPAKADLKNYASKYGIIIVCPDGQDSWYFDSPIDPTFQFETYVSQELRDYIDRHYLTRTEASQRAITGLSMGGHGALWLAFRHPDIYGSCGSMSGGVDIYNFPDKWKIDKRLGPWAANKKRWREHSVANLVSTLRTDQNIIIDDGNRDIFIKENNALHKSLQARGIKHDYSVRPGVHDWKYWVESLRYHMEFFDRCFRGEKHPQVTK